MKRLPIAMTLVVAACVSLGCGPSKKELKAELEQVKQTLADTESQMTAAEAEFKDSIAKLEADLAQRRAELDELSAQKKLTAEQLAQARADQERREAELQTYKRLFDRLKQLVDTGQIKVVFRKGKLMVQLESAVLFDSGKIKLKDNGKESLTAITDVLKNEGRDFLVAGHTDNVPIRSRRFASNWELSTARAVTVVRFMIDQGFPAKNLGAAGFGEFDPVASNDSADTRADNRRIEIVLMPGEAQMKGIREILGTGGGTKKKRKRGKRAK